MKNIYIVLSLFLIILYSTQVIAKNKDNALVNINYQNNRYPLIEKPYIELPIGSISPAGWLREQMNRMRTGLTGNLDKVYEKE